MCARRSRPARADAACLHRVEESVAPITINHQGLFPSVTLSFNLAPGHALGDAVAAIQTVERRPRGAGGAGDELPGDGAGVSGLAAARSPI